MSIVESLTMARVGRAQPATGISLLDARPEIIEEGRKLLEHTPELQALVRGRTAVGSRAE